MDRFEEIMETVFKWEGGFVNNPHDRGGPTNMGITHTVLARWRGVSAVSVQEVRDLTQDEATEIYKSRYWNRIGGAKLPAPVDLIVMDGAVNHGVPTMSRFVQELLETDATGRLKQSDFEALASATSSEDDLIAFAANLAELRKQRYVNHASANIFLRGWRNRLNDVMRAALDPFNASWTFSGGLSDSEAGGGETEPDPVSSVIRPVIEDEDLQSALATIGYYEGDIDGIFGPISVAAMNRVLAKNTSKISGNWQTWSIKRRKIALGQLICHDLGIDAGRIDGLFGPQTEFAFLEFNRIQLGAPEDTWLDDIDDLVGGDTAGPISGPWPRQSEVPNFYGPLGTNCRRVESVRLDLPFEMKIAWDLNTKIDGFFINRKVRDSAARVFDKVYAHYGDDGIEEIGVNLFGGCFNCRRMRGSNRWSMHAWAIAIDFDPARNRLRWNHTSARLAKPDAVRFWELWEEEGWVSLGRARDFDWMHVQAARL